MKKKNVSSYTKEHDKYLKQDTRKRLGVSRFGRHQIPAKFRDFLQDGQINPFRPPLGRIVISWQTAGDLESDLKVLAINVTINMVDISSVLCHLHSK